MTILFDSPRSAKSATRKPFAKGLSLNPTRQPFTAADLAWWATNSPANAFGYEVVGRSDAALEQAAGAALAQARMDAGGCPF